MLSQIKNLVRDLLPRFVEIRRHLHSYPELSGKEHQTAAYVANILSSYDIPVEKFIGKTGVVGHLINDSEKTSVLAIRTDMDALPIEEKTKLNFSSYNPGIMHACGHDVHTTVGIGTAIILSMLKKELRGHVRFLFQPAEEIAQGAKWMVRDGVMNNVDAIIGVHVFPSLPAGSIGIKYGTLTAAVDDIEVFIKGESGHGARPHEAVDAIWIASQIITTLQQAISRTQNPLHPLVLTIGQIAGGHAPNIIADRVKMTGTIRSLHPETRAQLPKWIETIIANVCKAHNAKYEIDYRWGVASVQNDTYLTSILEEASREAWGNDSIKILSEPSLGSEDFSSYLQYSRGTMFRLGTGYSNKINHPLHHPLFDIDESAIAVGITTLAYTAYKYWEK
ncbi:M20 family metallopeptidase [Candidatus Atelocyanobacterium thalassae]|uniref:N-acetyldiaminopimelate deacetylase n=1 Tax=cyanobacterium endosymbiont of Braarudosphaera bigelowii TaxID=1285375 RepID=A0ABM7U4W2_9CHRO|nr:M20 family metallopeptidase [Candidatus Atelocyanobacterium thalassa]BDA39761.1 N-acetyldiaminopimelate deacetylase [cyanobacterium endosymbiont of Braarudosphaera bigelowii]